MTAAHPVPARLASSRWLRFARRQPAARLRLFCLPYAGGGASVYQPWLDLAPPELEVLPVEPPGRESRLSEPPFARLDPLVAALAKALGPYLDRPYALFGHSLGALVGFELARHVRRSGGLGPTHLLVSGCDSPDAWPPRPQVHALPAAEFVARLRRLNGTPAGVLENPELMDLLLPVLRADFAVGETYRYEADQPLDCPISVFAGAKGPDHPRRAAGRRAHTTSRCTLRTFPGDHFFLQSAREQLVAAVAADLVGGSAQQ